MLREPSDESLQSFSPHRHVSTHLIDLSSRKRISPQPLPPDALSVALSPAAEDASAAGTTDPAQLSDLNFAAAPASRDDSASSADGPSRASGALTRSERGESFGDGRSFTVFSRLSSSGRSSPYRLSDGSSGFATLTPHTTLPISPGHYFTCLSLLAHTPRLRPRRSSYAPVSSYVPELHLSHAPSFLSPLTSASLSRPFLSLSPSFCCSGHDTASRLLLFSLDLGRISCFSFSRVDGSSVSSGTPPLGWSHVPQ